MFRNGPFDIFRSANHTGSRPAQLYKVLADGGTIEHGVERGDFINPGGYYITNLCDLVHGR